MKACVDETKCIGCGACVSVYPENFDFDNETGLSKVISSENIPEEATDICPVGAITIEGNEE